jgi:hypothetical protein
MWNNIGGVIISVLTLYVVDCVFKPWSGQTKDSIGDVIISVLTLYVVDIPYINFLKLNEWVSERSLFNANSAIFQLPVYHGENKLIFNEMMMRSALY